MGWGWQGGDPGVPLLSHSEPCVWDSDPTKFSAWAAHSLHGLWGKHLLASASICTWSPMMPIPYAMGDASIREASTAWLQLVEMPLTAISKSQASSNLACPCSSLRGAGSQIFQKACTWHTLSPSGFRGLLPTSLRLSRGSSTRSCFEECKSGQAYKSQELNYNDSGRGDGGDGGTINHKNKRHG